MKQIKVSEATNTQLDWLVAKCEGLKCTNIYGHIVREFIPSYTTDWSQMGPIIEQEKISPKYHESDDSWSAYTYAFAGLGPTMLIAAARCYVASKLGETVEVPEEL